MRARAKKRLTKEERDMIIQPTIEEMKREKKEREELKQEVASLRLTTTQLQTETKELTKTVKSQSNIITRLGHLFGAFIFLILWFVLYQFVLIHSLESWQAFVGSMIIAAIFGYLADFHGYKLLVERLLRYSSDKE